MALAPIVQSIAAPTGSIHKHYQSELKRFRMEIEKSLVAQGTLGSPHCASALYSSLYAVVRLSGIEPHMILGSLGPDVSMDSLPEPIATPVGRSVDNWLLTPSFSPPSKPFSSPKSTTDEPPVVQRIVLDSSINSAAEDEDGADSGTATANDRRTTAKEDYNAKLQAAYQQLREEREKAVSKVRRKAAEAQVSTLVFPLIHDYPLRRHRQCGKRRYKIYNKN